MHPQIGYNMHGHNIISDAQLKDYGLIYYIKTTLVICIYKKSWWSCFLDPLNDHQ